MLLEDNKLSGHIPKAIGELRGLEKLFLSRNEHISNNQQTLPTHAYQNRTVLALA